jgi:hypothetical protein
MAKRGIVCAECVQINRMREADKDSERTQDCTGPEALSWPTSGRRHHCACRAVNTGEKN